MYSLGKKIAYYRKKKGLSQEKVAEYMEVSRQAVTKWENNQSKPSTENLLLLSKLFGVNVEDLISEEDLINESPSIHEAQSVHPQNLINEQGLSSVHPMHTVGKGPAILCGISLFSIFIYTFYGILTNGLSTNTLICSIIIAIPIQLLIHFYFSYAIKNNHFNGIAGFDPHIDYNIEEVKHLLARLDLHVGIQSCTYIILLCLYSFLNIKFFDLSNLLILLYIIEFLGTMMYLNYQSTDYIYVHKIDAKKAKISWFITSEYIFMVLIGVIALAVAFKLRHIENNTLPALKVAALFLLGITMATIGFFIEQHRVKKWDIEHQPYQVGKSIIICSLIALIYYIGMYII